MVWDPDFECGTCGKTFPAGWQARNNHCYSTGHTRPTYECDTCSRYFNSEHAREQHMWDRNHFTDKCSQCNETYPSEEQCKKHEIDHHNYCRPCDRTFQNRNNISQHLNSSTHRGQNVACPFCRKAYTTATGVAHHLESSSCPQAANVNRDELYRFVRSKDPRGHMTKNLLGWNGTPQYEVTTRTWNGSGYECYFCHRSFEYLQGLRQHISSPVHQQPLYHCPNCGQNFTMLAGIVNHFESETCGFTRFETVQRGIKGLIQGHRLIGY